MVKFVVQWMIAGSTDPSGKKAIAYPKNDLSCLKPLNTFATRLGIEGLKEQTAGDVDLITGNNEAHNRAKPEREAAKAARIEERAERQAEYLTSVKCYSCFKIGQLAKDCPNPRPPKCGYCDVRGFHLTADCPNYAAAIALEEQPQAEATGIRTPNPAAPEFVPAAQAEHVITSAPVPSLAPQTAANQSSPPVHIEKAATPAEAPIVVPLQIQQAAIPRPKETTNTAKTRQAIKGTVSKPSTPLAPIGDLAYAWGTVWTKDSNGNEFPLHWSQIRLVLDPNGGLLAFRIEGTALMGKARSVAD